MKRLAFLSFALATIGLTAFGHLANQQPTQQVRAQEQPKQADNGIKIHLPTHEQVKPAPVLVGVPKLNAATWLIMESDNPFYVFAAPAGLVKVSEETGPIKIKGLFANGTGEVETKTYTGKYIASIEAIGTGRVYLTAVPELVKDRKHVREQTVDVDSGVGPRPPPVPPGPPIPGPDVTLNELGKLVLMQAQKINVPATAKAMGANYVPVVASMRSGSLSVEQAIGELFKKNREAMGGGVDKWAGFFTWLDNELTRRAEKGLLTNVASHADAFEQIGAGLRKAGE